MLKKNIRAIDALEEAQRIAFAPFIFQTTVALRELGVLTFIFDRRLQGGASLEDIAEMTNVSEYGIGVLLELAESTGIVAINEAQKYELTKTGYFLNYDKAVNVNINFANDVCYKGMFHLLEAIKTGTPAGLPELGNWPTIYDGLSQLPPEIQKSWFEFDHHYSDDIFDEGLQRVFESNPKTIFDIGGNTGKFAIRCCHNNANVHVKIIDLPGQLSKALANANKEGFGNRVSGFEIDWLAPNPQLPKGADTIWMSQFLDCFSEKDILNILKACVAIMDTDTELLITETFTDRQKFDNAKFVLEATSLYFTALANGNSKMYPSEVFIRLIQEAGLHIERDISLGEYHTLFICKKSSH
ncbi:O-methyltransferase [Ulvibacter sp. MAR_2010_11]|uniref:methyltransferase n=1 Tax=Ulvibacter sp. MAR_2010_11 TaxID=1250229 RepID=UPI000C2B8279|nr:methyltransferase [Ulvibacter sp. MAR_2010_11]PKA83224.1 O-methyltransferase [Ulvibacter sp. MAR_2010_11]